jgi:hypothetical protein
MSMSEADHRQAAIYGRMTPQQRLTQALRLWRQARRLAEAGVRARHPEAPETEIRRRVARLFLYGRE